MIQNKIKGQIRKTRRTDKENFYLTNEMIYDEWLKWKNSAVEVQDRTIPNRLAIYIKQIAEKITHCNSFVGYNDELKQEMVSDAILKCIKNLKNMKEEHSDSFFNYLSRCCYCSIYATLSRHYKYVNLKKKLTDKAIDELEAVVGHTANIEQLRAYFQTNSDE